MRVTIPPFAIHSSTVVQPGGLVAGRGGRGSLYVRQLLFVIRLRCFANAAAPHSGVQYRRHAGFAPPQFGQRKSEQAITCFMCDPFP
jgi:hypothetical protein